MSLCDNDIEQAHGRTVVLHFDQSEPQKNEEEEEKEEDTAHINDSDIEFIKKQYLCCTPINNFRFTENHADPDKKINHEAQLKIYENTVGDSNSIKYPCRLSYRIAFLRHLIQKLEKDSEVCDVFYETLTNFMMISNDEDTTHYRQFLLKSGEGHDRIIIKESKHLISGGTTGLHSWKAGFALAEWCNANKTKIENKEVLELGSGVGLTGLSVIFTCSPKSYTFSDCHAKVLNLIVNNLQLNIDNNEKSCQADLRTVDWSEESYKTKYQNSDIRVKYLLWLLINENDVDASWANSNVVLASDVIYDESIFDELIGTLRVLIKKSNALVIIAATVRNEETLAAFLKKLDSYDLSYEDEVVPKPDLFLQFDETPVRILRIFNKV